ncbi:MAG: hypothetical protein NTY23_15625 [Chloroflexi bacterium]|nr:hypothetical protein [Chloroflexota bacterium]
MVNEAAYRAVEKVWALTIKARALCPYAGESAVGQRGYASPAWYRARGAVYFVDLAQPLTDGDVRELNEIGGFLNRSFVVSMAAVLEEYGVVPYRANPDRSKEGGDHAQLTKWLRHRFAHGEWEYDAGDPEHVKTRQLLEELFPEEAKKGTGFLTSIDGILEPLKNGVLAYIRAAT